MIELHNFLLGFSIKFSMWETAFGDVKNKDEDNADEEDENEEKDLD